MTNKKRRGGFTLAELLIAIVVIGVVSALTIPTIIKNYQKRQFLIKLKDTYSILQNAKIRAEADYGPMKNWDVTGSADYFEKFVKPYLKVEKMSARHGARYTNGTAHSYYANPFSNGEFIKYLLPNGVELSTGTGWACSFGYWGHSCNIFIDLNNIKTPNTYGKDIHIFTYDYTSGKLVPSQYKSSDATLKDGCLTTSESYFNGPSYCTSAIFKNNWQYPDWFPY